MDIKVTKRNGKKEPVMFEKITARIKEQMSELDHRFVFPSVVAQRVIKGITDGIETRQLDVLAMQEAAMLVTVHPDYGKLASKIAITSLHKETDKSFSQTMKKLYEYTDKKTGKHLPIISKDFYELVKQNADKIDSAIIHARDHNYDYFGYKTMEKSYLLKIDGRVAERPQFMFMRTALQIWGDNIDEAIKTYNLLSENYYTHATPTLFNSGTNRTQLSSCFLLDVEDSIEGLYDTLKESALISKNAGGIGISFSKIRAKNSYISGTNGVSSGIVNFLKVYNETARAVDQGGNKRKGSIAIYLEPWHADIFDFLDLKKNHGKEELRARDLFYAIWMNDLFMERLISNGTWSLMCPNQSSGLTEVYGEEFKKLYTKYEKDGLFIKQIKARELWAKILEAQMENGVPYILYKDSINEKSNQKNIGIIRSSNLCAEIVEATGVTKSQESYLKNKELLESLGLGSFYGKDSVNETSVCNLASLSLPKFVNKNKTYAYNKLYEVAYQATINLNRVIDTNYYPSESAKFSNILHRPIGLGVQGLADVFFIMGLPFDSDEARDINKNIFETIYYAAMRASCDLAKKDGPYATYDGSPVSQGLLQYDLWGVTPSERWDWNKLKKDIAKWGVRNSLTTCIMPTASTASILGNEASCEPQTFNIGTRSVLAGSFQIINKYLIKDLIKLGLWDENMKNELIKNDGSVQNISNIPDNIKSIYKTVFEIKQKVILDMASDRGAFIDQTQSMNIFMTSPDFNRLNNMHLYGWGVRPILMDSDNNPILPENAEILYDEYGNPIYYRHPSFSLKTGIYYLRSEAAAKAIKFTTSDKKEDQKSLNDETTLEAACNLDDPNCETCSA